MAESKKTDYYWEDLGDLEQDILWDIAHLIFPEKINVPIPEFKGKVTVTIEFDPLG
jgi:hypothetical protein